jgi:hypothetical protein
MSGTGKVVKGKIGGSSKGDIIISFCEEVIGALLPPSMADPNSPKSRWQVTYRSLSRKLGVHVNIAKKYVVHILI